MSEVVFVVCVKVHVRRGVVARPSARTPPVAANRTGSLSRSTVGVNLWVAFRPGDLEDPVQSQGTGEEPETVERPRRVSRDPLCQRL